MAERRRHKDDTPMETGQMSVSGTPLHFAKLMQEAGPCKLGVGDRLRYTAQTAYVFCGFCQR